MPVGLDDGTFVVGLPNEFARDWVESRFGDLLREALRAVMAADIEVRLVKLKPPTIPGQESGRPRRRFRACFARMAACVSRQTFFQFERGESPQGR